METSWILSRPYQRLTGGDACGPDAPAQPRDSMRLADFVFGIETIRSSSTDPLVSWRQGRDVDLSDLGPLGETVASAPSLGAALRCLASGFPALQSGTRVRFEIDGEKARFSYRVLDCRIWPRRADSELTLGFVAGLAARFGVPPAAFEEISFEHETCERTAHLAAAFRRHPRMGAPENAMILPVQSLDNRPPARSEGDDRSFHEGLRALARCMAELRRSESLSTRVRHALLEGIGQATIDQNAIARRLGMSRRSLRRHLHSEGSSFHELLEESRRACGYAMLTRSRMPLSEIALALGYSDQTAFSRAFSRWFGETPRELRRSGGREESVIR